jgi:hypothetical protein
VVSGEHRRTARRGHIGTHHDEPGVQVDDVADVTSASSS